MVGQGKSEAVQQHGQAFFGPADDAQAQVVARFGGQDNIHRRTWAISSINLRGQVPRPLAAMVVFFGGMAMFFYVVAVCLFSIMAGWYNYWFCARMDANR